MAMFFNVKPDRVSFCRGTRFLSSPEPTLRARNRTPNRMIRSVATSQTIVDARIRKPSALFRFSNPNDSIHFQNGSHFNRYRTPQYAKNTMAMRQTIWTKSGVFPAGPLRRSQIASAAAKRKGQEDIQLSLESIYSVQRALPSHWENEDREYACGPLDTPPHGIGRSSLAPDGAHFAEEGPRAASESVLRNPCSRSGND